TESARHQRLRAGHGLGPARLDDRGAMGDAVGRGELRRVAGPPGIIEGRGQGFGARSNGCCCGHREGQEADGDTAKHGKAKIVTPGTHGCCVAVWLANPRARLVAARSPKVHTETEEIGRRGGSQCWGTPPAEALPGASPSPPA